MFVNNFDYMKSYMNFGFPVYQDLSLIWSMGFMLICSIMLQIVTGWLVSLNMMGLGLEECYFSSLYIFLYMEYGWLLIIMHGVVPSFIFCLMYLHIFSVFFYPVHYFAVAWFTGILIFLLFVVMVFTGYSLVCGSMGYWAIMVVHGIVSFVFGGFVGDMVFSSLESITSRLMVKVFCYHYLLGFLCLFFIYYHIHLNHKVGPSGICSYVIEEFSFFSLIGFSDFYLSMLWEVFCMLCFCFMPEFFYSCDNYMVLNVLSVPEEINAEWYLSIFFIILKSIYSKFLGLVGMFYVFFSLGFKYFVSSVLGFYYVGVCFNSFFVYLLVFIVVACFHSYMGFLSSTSVILLVLSVSMMIGCVEVVKMNLYCLIL